jgi:hypothetical protein
MTSDQPRSPQIFEAKAGPLPRLKPAAPPEADDVLEADEAPAVARPRSKWRCASGAATREVVLRIVEAVKAL